MVGDELLALDAERLSHPVDLDALLDVKRSGEQRELLISREGLVRTVTISPASPTIKAWSLGLVADQSERTATHRNRWLSLQPA
jgi:hypothetical protein